MALIPYKQVYDPVIDVHGTKKDPFVPGEILHVCIKAVHKNTGADRLFMPFIYEVQLQHASFEWSIRKTFMQFSNLHTKLKLASVKKTITGEGDEASDLPRFPRRPEVMVNNQNIQRRRQRLEEYLQKVMDCQYYRNLDETKEFIEVCGYSFIDQLGPKYKEGKILKRKWDQKFLPFCSGAENCLRGGCGQWHTRWMVLKDSALFHVDPKAEIIKGVMLLDGMTVRRLGWSRHGVEIKNQSRKMVLTFNSRRKAKEWKDAIVENQANSAKDFNPGNRFGSYAPQRQRLRGTWYVDGKDYMEAVADAILEAKEEIFITDWWLSPEVYLKRPVTDDHRWRLDNLLKKKADEGVRIFVLLYKDIEFAVGIKTSYSKHALQDRHTQNIKVLRHPDVVKGETLWWSHHEKMVVIDQTYAFLGGIDLCYGRWDDHRHKLTDFPTSQSTNSLAPIMSASMPGTTDLMRSPVYQLAATWTKLGNQTVATSSTAEATQEEGDDTVDLPDGEASQEKGKFKKKAAMLQRIRRGFRPKKKESERLWVGTDYVNFYIQDVLNVETPDLDTVDRSNTPRVPWHDIALAVAGEAARDVARHFVQRWNHVKVAKAQKDLSLPYLLPKSYERAKDPPPLLRHKTFTVDCQIVRSSSKWSAGITKTDSSIQKAYVHFIETAQHYIYIENQFFVTMASGNGKVTNQIHDALYNRIIKAHKQGKKFRVYVIVPLMPGFKGRYGDPSSSALHAVTHWNYASMCRGPHSLIQRLLQAGVTQPHEYISFCSLRTSGQMQGYMVTELIYIHSKLMIVDDRVVICGSANINDRSLLGDRDSEMAAVIQDINFDPSTMGGEPFEAGRYAGSLRRHLFMEHLGLLEGDDISADPLDANVSDPVDDSFFNGVWTKVAQNNSDIFEEVFNCIPSNKIVTFNDLSQLRDKVCLAMTNPEEARKKLKSVRGNLVVVPLDFLKDQNLTPPAGSIEYLLPDCIFI